MVYFLGLVQSQWDGEVISQTAFQMRLTEMLLLNKKMLEFDRGLFSFVSVCNFPSIIWLLAHLIHVEFLPIRFCWFLQVFGRPRALYINVVWIVQGFPSFLYKDIERIARWRSPLNLLHDQPGSIQSSSKKNFNLHCLTKWLLIQSPPFLDKCCKCT